MKYFTGFLVVLAFLWTACSPKTNDGVTPNQPAYTGNNYPNPMIFYNGTLAAGVSVASPYLPSPYDAALTIGFGDTSVRPISGNANMVFGVTNYSTSNSEYNGATWVAFGLVPSGAPTIDLTSGNYSQATFYAQGSFAAGVTQAAININVGGSATTPITLTTNWKSFSIPLPANLTAVSQYLVVGMSLPSDLSPFKVYIDQFQYH